MIKRPLGSTGIQVSPIGLGTVKFGRNQQLKYPQPFDLPGDAEIKNLLALAQELGINLLDTAPAYGSSQERLGRLLKRRQDWVIISKVGEFFIDGQSHFDFSYQATVDTVKQSLKALRTDYLDGVLIHSNGQDMHILQKTEVVPALEDLKQQGWIRSHGISSKTLAGGLAAVGLLDMVMMTLNLDYRDELPVLEAAQKQNKGILIKKGLQSGHAQQIADSIQYILSFAAVSSLIIGTINPQHLQQNIALAQQLLK